MSNEPRSRAQSFDALSQDKRLSHGAVRVWHRLYHHRNAKTGLCCPSYKTLAEEIGANKDSIANYAKELESAGWLEWEKTARRPKRGKPRPPGTEHRYTLLDGLGNILELTPKQGSVPRPLGRGRTDRKNRTVRPLRRGPNQSSAISMRSGLSGKDSLDAVSASDADGAGSSLGATNAPSAPMLNGESEEGQEEREFYERRSV